jgi:phenylpropionate dioxygenase-like ring-hydroxylating dioxygenase large terminal subunit
MDLVTQKKLLMEVGPGTPMNESMKRFWLPLALSADVPEPDGDPMRVRALGEDYVLFRDTAGRLGLLDELCTHRSASLCLGRNEEGGLRCIYHGWKFAVDGAVLETPNVQDPRFKERVRQPSFAVREAGGIVWGYLGPKDKEPPFPHYPFFDLPDENVVVELVVANANYTRIVEGLLDSSHTGILHQDALSKLGAGQGPAPSFGGRARVSTGAVLAKNLAPEIEVQETDFGLRYAAIRHFEDEHGRQSSAARITAFVYPTTVCVPPDYLIQITLPVDNERSHFFMVFWDPTRNIRDGEARQEILSYYGIDETATNTFGLGRKYKDLPDRPNRDNNWLQDRKAMKEGRFTGLHRFIPEDFAVSESMGVMERFPIEHLVPADLAVARFRRRIIENAQRVARGEEPHGLSPKEPYRGGYVTLSEGQSWKDVFAAELAAEGAGSEE